MGEVVRGDTCKAVFFFFCVICDLWLGTLGRRPRVAACLGLLSQPLLQVLSVVLKEQCNAILKKHLIILWQKMKIAYCHLIYAYIWQKKKYFSYHLINTSSRMQIKESSLCIDKIRGVDVPWRADVLVLVVYAPMSNMSHARCERKRRLCVLHAR